METDEKKIPWGPIERRLKKLERKVPWLAEKLDVEKNAVYNWPKRGGVPMAYLPKLVEHLQVNADDLLEAANVKSAKRGTKAPLSDEAKHLIQCVIRIDRLGDAAREIFRLHTGLLLLSHKSTPPQDLSAEQDFLEQVTLELEDLEFRNRLIGGDDAANKGRRD
jgi:hypothetical protein